MFAATFALIAGVLAQADPTPPDVNGDGVPEYAQFAPNSVDLRLINGATNAVLWSAVRPACGPSVSSNHLWWSDLDGGGIADIVVSRPRCPTSTSVGEIEVLSGATGATLWLLAGASDRIFAGAAQPVSDQTWDGVPELLAALTIEGAVSTAVIDGRRGVVLDTLAVGLSELLAADEQGVRLFTPADVDLSGSVNAGDLDLLLDWYSSDDIRADIDGDGFWTPIDIQWLIDEMNAGVMTIRGYIASSLLNGGQPCTESLQCACDDGEQANATQGQTNCNLSEVGVEVLLDCGQPGKPKATITGFPPPSGSAPYMRSQVCTTFERLNSAGTVESTRQFPGLLPQHLSGSAYDEIMSTSGRWRVTTVVAWCFNGQWCCASDTCEFVVASPQGDNTDPCSGGSDCAFVPGAIHGLPDSCIPPLRAGRTIDDPIFVVPGQWMVLTVERGNLISEQRPGCPNADPQAPSFPGEYVYEIVENPAFPESGAGGVLNEDHCDEVGATVIVPNDWLPGMSFSLTFRMGHSGCEVHEVTYFFMISPDNDADHLLDCFETAHSCPNFNLPDSDGDGVLDGDEVALAGLAFQPNRCTPADPQWPFFNPCDPILPHQLDHDRDGISTVNELARFGSNPLAFDTDRGGGQDTAELELFSHLPNEEAPAGQHFNPRIKGDLRADSPLMQAHDRDDDGLFDSYELVRGWDTDSSDQDADGIRDGLEMRFPSLHGPELADQGPSHPSLPTDTDRDGLSDSVERRMGTNARDPDSDNDGVSDGAEAAMGLDPTDEDSDGDGIDDGDLDFDGDGVSNADERMKGLNPGDSDTNDDGECDTAEAWTASDYNRNVLDAIASNGSTCTYGVAGASYGYLWPDNTVSHTIYPGGVLGPCSGTCPPVCIFTSLGSCYTFIFTNGCPDVGAPMASCPGPYPGRCGPTIQSTSGPSQCYGDIVWVVCFPFPEGSPTEDLNVDPEDVFPPNTLPPSDPNNPPNRDDIHDANGDGVVDYRDAPLAVDLDILANSLSDDDDRNESKAGEPGAAMLASTFDADGDNIPDFADGFNLFGNRVPGTSRASESAPVRELDNVSPHKMIPVTVRIRGIIANPPERGAQPDSFHSQRISFDYEGSDPHRVGKTLSDLFHLPATGRYRLWARFYDRKNLPAPPPTRTPLQLANDITYGNSAIPSAEARPNDNVTGCAKPDHYERHLDTDRDGDGDIDGADQLVPNADGTDIQGMRFLHPGQQYDLFRLGITPWTNEATITIWLEPIGHSEEIGERITAEVHASNNAVAAHNACVTTQPGDPHTEFGYKDCVTVTAVSMGFTPIDHTGDLGQMQPAVPVSYVTPTFTPINFFVENIEIDPSDSRKLRADLRVYASLDDAVADLVPGVEGTIQAVGVLLNDQPLPGFNGEGELVIPVFPQKSTGSNNPLAPFDFTGQIASISELRDVEVQAGTNRLRLLAMNARGNVGWIEWTFTIDARENEPLALLAEIDTQGVNLEGEPSEQLILRVVPPALANDPAAWTTRTLTWTGEPREFEDDSLRLVLDFAATTPTAVDTLAATLYEHGAVDPTLTVVLNETDVNTTIFRGPVPLSDPPSGTWERHAISLSTSRPIASTQSNGGMPNRFVIEFKGPAPTDSTPNALEQMQRVFDRFVVGNRSYPLTTYDQRLVLRQGNHPDLITPAVFMTVPTSASAAVPVSTDGNVGPPIQFQLPRSSAVEFIEGFGEGLLAAGTDFVDGLEALWSGVERASDWAYAVFFELRRGDTTAVSQDIAKIGVAIKKGIATLGPVAEVVWQLVLDTDLFYEALVLREEAAIEQLGEEYGLYLEMMAELIDATRELLASIEITSHQKGWIAGRLTGEIVVEVGLSLATGGAGTAIRAVQKSEKIVSLTAKLAPVGANAAQRGKHLLQFFGLGGKGSRPQVAAQAVQASDKILLLADRAQKVITSRMCFVAGTLVWTATGLQPIECVREGDLVLSRSTITGENAWKQVTKTFVTHPAELVRVTIASGEDATNERVECITGTPEHPVWVKERRDFVGLGSLIVGQHLERTDRGPARVLSVTTTRGPPLSEGRSAPQPSLHGWTGSRFTTYNFEVGDFHTYFVGESGIWVHNRGPFCKRVVDRIVKRAAALPLHPSGRPDYFRGLILEAPRVDEVMERRWTQRNPGIPPRIVNGVPEWDDLNQAVRRNVFLGMSDDIVAGAVSAGYDFRHLPTYNEYNSLFSQLPPGWMRGRIPKGGGSTVVRPVDAATGSRIELPGLNIAAHHASPTSLTLEMFIDMMIPGRDRDWMHANAPCVPLEIAHHEMFHRILNERLALVDPDLAEPLAIQKRKQLREAYRLLSLQPDGPGAIANDIGALVDGWLDAQGIR